MIALSWLTNCTFVLAQRTPLNAAFGTIGLDRILEERRIELPKRSEEAMVLLSAIEMGAGAEADVGSFVDEAQSRRKLLELSLENPKLWGGARSVTISPQPKTEKPLSKKSNPLSDLINHLLDHPLITDNLPDLSRHISR